MFVFSCMGIIPLAALLGFGTEGQVRDEDGAVAGEQLGGEVVVYASFGRVSEGVVRYSSSTGPSMRGDCG